MSHKVLQKLSAEYVAELSELSPVSDKKAKRRAIAAYIVDRYGNDVDALRQALFEAHVMTEIEKD